jgi:hypothetical protein
VSDFHLSSFLNSKRGAEKSMSSAPKHNYRYSRRMRNANPADSKVNPISPKSGTELPVLGKRAGFGSGVDGASLLATATGAGADGSSIRSAPC